MGSDVCRIRPLMIVGTLELHLRMDGCNSLKDKRRILRSLADRVRREFQAAVAEIDDCDLWNVATVGVACVSNDARHAGSILQKIEDFVATLPEVVVEGAIREIVRT